MNASSAPDQADIPLDSRQANKRDRRETFLTILFFFCSVVTLLSCAGIWMVMEYRAKLLREDIQSRLIAVSKLAAGMVSPAELAAIRIPDDINTQAYGQIKDRLTKIARDNNVSRVYFARETKEGLLQYIVDSNQNPDTAEGIATGAKNAKESMDVIRTAMAGIANAQDPGIYIEGAEKMISAFSPVFDPAGQVFALAGVDLPDDGIVILERLGLFVRIMGLVSAVLSIVSAGASFVTYRNSVREAKIANLSKSDFLSRMSHEMRTPLNAIIGLSMLTLEADNLQKESKENIAKVNSAGITLLNIINDILDISKVESGKFELNPVEYDVPSMINDTITLNSMRIKEKPIVFRLHLSETLPSRLYGDDLRVKQVFNNILSNAFKYTAEGTVDWTLNWERDGLYVWLVSEVRDTGIGIKTEDLGNLFKSYSQVDTRTNRKIEGTGLGLSIAQSMIKLMHGSVAVESVYGMGTKFTVRIRQDFVNEAPPIGPQVAASLIAFKYQDNKRVSAAGFVRLPLPNASVLVVDDMPVNLDVAKGMMKPYKMRIDCVTSGRQAVALIREARVKYDAVFMDHMMPEMDGIETTRIIRSEIGTDYAQNVPIIALTANAIRGSDEMFLDRGFNAFLAKPIDVMQLDAIIRRWVRKEADRQENTAENRASIVEHIEF